jgi:hypothetical protein
MVINIFIAFIFSFAAYAQTSELKKYFSQKNYLRVENLYTSEPDKSWTFKEMAMISYSMKKNGSNRPDINLTLRMLNNRYAQQHKELILQVRNNKTVEGENFPEAMKIMYWSIFKDYAYLIKKSNKTSVELAKDAKFFSFYYKILSELEFREIQVDKLNEQVSSYVKYLSDKIYHFSYSFNFQLVSWQKTSSIQNSSAGIEGDLIITNIGYCLGGDAGLENEFHHFYVDGCLLLGSGGVSANADSQITYSQSQVPAHGFKGGVGYSKIVSSSKSRIGVRIPIVYTVQELNAPADPLYTVDSDAQLDVLVSLYSRWHFQKWYFQTEFGKYTAGDENLWGLGIGRSF